MKMRKLYAGLAVMATLLGGLALGAASANAADTDQVCTVDKLDFGTTITINGSKDTLTGRSWTLYKLAAYTSTAADPSDLTVTGAALQITTDATNKGAIEAAAGSSGWNDEAKKSYPDAMAWASSLGAGNSADNGYAGKVRDFTTELAAKAAADATDPKLTAVANPTGTPDNDATSATYTFSNLDKGLYLIVDTSSPTSGATKSLPILVGTSITAKTGATGCVVPDNATGAVNVKNGITPGDKTIDDSDVYIGQTVHYTLSGAVPSTVGTTSYMYQLIDKPGKGQTVDLGTLKVYVGKTKGATGVNWATDWDEIPFGAADNNYQLTRGTADVTSLTGQTLKADGTTTFTIDLSKYVRQSGIGAPDTNGTSKIGFPIRAVYSATINEEAIATDVDGKIVNDLTVNNNGTTLDKHTEAHTYGFGFTKVQADGQTALTGARFTLQRTNADGAYLTYDSAGNTWKETAKGQVTDNNIASYEHADVNGAFSFTGLDSGTYYLVETTVPDGYMNLGVKFTVTISDADKDGVAEYTFTNATNPAIDPLVVDGTNGQEGATLKVKNVKSITELPLTGAAGTALFTVVALLLAGCAGTVYVRSRSTRRALMR